MTPQGDDENPRRVTPLHDVIGLHLVVTALRQGIPRVIRLMSTVRIIVDLLAEIDRRRGVAPLLL